MAANPEPLEELLAQVESMQNMLRVSLSDSADVAELKTKMEFLWGNGKPGKIAELEHSDHRLTQAYWYMRGALWVMLGLLATFVLPLTIWLAEKYLEAHK
jgi:hypothetical protein